MKRVTDALLYPWFYEGRQKQEGKSWLSLLSVSGSPGESQSLLKKPEWIKAALSNAGNHTF